MANITGQVNTQVMVGGQCLKQATASSWDHRGCNCRQNIDSKIGIEIYGCEIQDSFKCHFPKLILIQRF